MAKEKLSLKEGLKFVFEHLPSRSKFYLGVSAILISSVLSAVVPFIYGRLIDLALNANSSFYSIGKLIVFWVSLSILANLFGKYGNKKSYELSIDLSNSLTSDLYSHIINLPISFYKEKKIGEVNRKIDRGAGSMYTIIEDVLFSFFPAVLSFFIALIILFSVEWRLAAILIVMSGIFVLITLHYTKQILKTQIILHRKYEKSYGSIFDIVRNIPTVKSNTNENLAKKIITKELNEAGRVEKNWRFLWLKMGLWQGIIDVLGFSSVFSFGILMLRGGTLTAGSLVMFIAYIPMLTRPLSNLASQYRQLNSSLMALGRALKLYDYFPERDTPKSLDLDIKGKVEFKQVYFYYKKTVPILNNISFVAEPGEKVAIVGESGVGKTTLVDLIGRYYHPQKGKILIDNIDIKRISLKSLRKQMAAVPQEVALFNDTIKQNIRYGRLNATEKEIIEAAQLANASEFIEKFPQKYNQVVGERGIKLSTGQKQRIAIARAILRNPKILILDEATSALDSVSEKLVQEGLERLMRGRTSFIIAHRLSTIKSADKIIVLKEGEIVEMGKHEDLILKSDGVYRQFWEMQSGLQNSS